MKKRIIIDPETGQVRTVTIDNKNYFYVQDIKSNRPDLKVDVDKIIYVDKKPLFMRKMWLKEHSSMR